MSTLRLELPPKLIPVFASPQKRFRGAKGGRGSAKTRSFAKMAAVIGAKAAEEGRQGIILCAREFMNSLDDSSFAEVAAAIESEPWLKSMYDIGRNYIRTKDGRVEFSFIGLRHNLDSLKSKALIILCWIDEAERVSEAAWVKLIPTVREVDSEIWITWNPERKGSATDLRFGGKLDPDMIIVELNWRDNPWFPAVLEAERQRDQRDRPEEYGHIWEGEYATAHKGAYFAKHLTRAKTEGRICRVPLDPMMSVLTYHDLAGASDKADAYAIWVCQFIGREIRVLDHYETVGQSPHMHTNWLKEWCRAREIKRVIVKLPHDGNQVKIDSKWIEYWDRASDREVTFEASIIGNQGRGAAMKRVAIAREQFPKIWFNESTTEAGRQALGYYHEKWDSERNIGLGPDHDWSSHSADAFGLMCCDYVEPRALREGSAAPKRRSQWAL
jgi:phage terminase large subunit